MKQPRVLWLLAIMCALVLVRWLFPPTSTATANDVVVAIVKPAMTSRVIEAMPHESTPVLSGEARDVPGDAFAVRVVRQPPPPPLPPPVKVVAFRGPPAPPPPAPPPPPPPPPPLQVIGTWDDGESPGVFISTGQSTVLARLGTLLLSEYRVTAITPQQVSITHATSKHVWQLPIPRTTANR